MSKSHLKSRKRGPSKGKHGGLAAKAPMEERKRVAKTVKEQKPLFHFVLKFFSLLWELGRKLFSSGPREKKKEPSFPPERPDAASSSFALATPSGVSVAAKRASEEQTEGPAVKLLSFGTVNDKDPCHDHISTGNSNDALTLDPEGLEEVFSSNGLMVGDIFCPIRVGFQRKEESNVKSLERLHVIEDEEIESEQPGNNSEDWEKKYYDQKKVNDHLKNERGVLDNTVELRQVLSNFEKTREGEIMDDGIEKEVLKLLAAKSKYIDMSIIKPSFSKILRTMFFQRANMDLKSKFRSIDWRNDNLFPKFSNESAAYQWWGQNFNPDILEERLEIFRLAAKSWNPKLDMYMIIDLVSDLNSRLHPQPSKNEFNEKDEVKMLRLLTTICYLRSARDSKI